MRRIQVALAHASVIHQHIDRAEALDDRSKGVINSPVVGHIHYQWEATRSLYLITKYLDAVPREVSRHDFSARDQEAPHVGGTHAPGAASDNDDLAIEASHSEFHDAPPPMTFVIAKIPPHLTPNSILWQLPVHGRSIYAIGINKH
jgi:hypothetical protein